MTALVSAAPFAPAERDQPPRNENARLVLVAFCLFALVVSLSDFAITVAVGALVESPVCSLSQYFVQTWLPFYLLLPLIGGMLLRFPPDRRHLGVHLPAPLLFAGLHALLSAVIGTGGTGRTTAAVLAELDLPILLSFHLLTYSGAGLGLAALRKHREVLRRAENAVLLEGALIQARLSRLRAQLNPHFLFNTLNALSTLARRGDAAGVTNASRKLSELLQYALDDSSGEEISLESELRAVRTYLDIQRMRFGHRLRIEISVDPAASNVMVPPMLLQPIVENAIVHGIAPKVGPGSVIITVRKAPDAAILSVENDGVALRPYASSSRGIGMENVRARLRFLYGRAGTVEIAERDGGGAVTTIRIPLGTQGRE